MKTVLPKLLSGDVVEEQLELTLMDLSRVSGLPAEEITVLVEEGIIEPVGSDSSRWRFHGVCLRRVRCAVRLHRDLGVNWAGTALALELLDEVGELRQRLRRLESGLHE